MKKFTFLVPVGIAAAALIGGNTEAQRSTPPTQMVEQISSQQEAGRNLLMVLPDQDIPQGQLPSQRQRHRIHLTRHTPHMLRIHRTRQVCRIFQASMNLGQKSVEDRTVFGRFF